ncbi:acyltransferase [Arthrobacter sp. PAMC25284]|uniref:acyltransferase family protein n=1 Tax=Arthrobacter sp. PAMC25284 TaxID=2861279 RepID=UPI001C631E45|nr:acyltransferase [Arthrobacter sp. PAMC25284]QYF89362.1 acyltransferase [Arthrobacter sp. PAMC25284]
MQFGERSVVGAQAEKLHSLTSLRFFAALLVVMHHTFRDLVKVPGLSDVVWLGTVGVSFFFALSGFVLTWSLREDDTKRAFYRRRFARVYPLHLIALVLGVGVFLFVGKGFDARQFLAGAALLQAWIPDSKVYFALNAPSWSLSCEALFYAAFPFFAARLVRMGRPGLWKMLAATVGLSLVIAGTVTMALTPGDGAQFWLYIFPPFRILEFVAGCLLALLIKSGWRSPFTLPAAAVSAGVIYTVLMGSNRQGFALGNGLEDAIMLPFILAVIASAATASLTGREGFLAHPWAVRLGEWSFALYITHWLLLLLVEHLDPGSKARPVAFQLLEGCLFVLLAVAISAAAYTWIEKPLEKRLRGPPSAACGPDAAAPLDARPVAADLLRGKSRQAGGALGRCQPARIAAVA